MSCSKRIIELAKAFGFDFLHFVAGFGGPRAVLDIVAMAGDVVALAIVVANASAALVAGEERGHAVSDVGADTDEDEAFV